ncbi:MAG: peptidylprolyl isomerase [Bacteroidales bacterium]|nr:peptidylprolyl isomerase [Bacteroidales bacterium]
MKKIFILASLLSLLLFSCKNGENNQEGQDQQQAAAQQAEPEKKEEPKLAFNPDSLGTEPQFDIVTSMGTIRVKLYEDTPKHKKNFIRLAANKYYDGITFHRVINHFMIQTGDPYTRDYPDRADVFGTGGPGYTVPAEIKDDAGKTLHLHKKGALAAARKGDRANPEKASSGSQFYIVQDANACKQLDGDYTVFGETVSGLDIVDKIASVKTGAKDRPLTDIKIISILPVK